MRVNGLIKTNKRSSEPSKLFIKCTKKRISAKIQHLDTRGLHKQGFRLETKASGSHQSQYSECSLSKVTSARKSKK